MTSTIISQSTERGKRRITFRHQEGDLVFGPYVETRPEAEGAQVFVDAHRSVVNAEFQRPTAVQQLKNLLDAQVGVTAFDAFRRALKDLGVNSMEISGADNRQIEVNYPSFTNAEDVVTALRMRIDAIAGVGTFVSIRNALRNAGGTKVILARTSELNL